MNATLEKEIATLSLDEKRRLIDELWRQVEPIDDDRIALEMLAQLERRADAYDSNPIGGMTLEQFEVITKSLPRSCESSP
jgi:putative addiction module component (TIGR02574 family)